MKKWWTVVGAREGTHRETLIGSWDTKQEAKRVAADQIYPGGYRYIRIEVRYYPDNLEL